MAIYTLDDLRSSAGAAGEGLSDSQLINSYASRAGMDPNAVAEQLGFQRSTYDAAKEVGRQAVGGVAVDLPRMAGQAMRWTTTNPNDKTGQNMVNAADARAPDYAPDTAGAGVVGNTLAKGARALGPMIPIVAASAIPGVGEFAGPALAGAAFGASSAQDMSDKITAAGGTPDQARRAGWQSGAIMGPAMLATAGVGGAAFRGALGAGADATMDSVVNSLTQSGLKNAGVAVGENMLVQPAVMSGAAAANELVSRANGGTPEDMWSVVKDSAQTAIGMTALLGPFAAGAQMGHAKRAAAMDAALNNPNAPPELRQMAEMAVAHAAVNAGVPKEQITAWQAERAQAAAQADVVTPPPAGASMLAGETPHQADQMKAAGEAAAAQADAAPTPLASDNAAPAAVPAPAVAPHAPDMLDQSHVDPAVIAQREQAGTVAQQSQQAAAEQQSRVEAIKQKIAADQAAKTDAENQLGGAEVDAAGKRVNKVPGRYTDAYLELKAAHDEGLITPQQFSDQTDRLIAALQTQDNKTLNTVRKETDALRNPKPVVEAPPKGEKVAPEKLEAAAVPEVAPPVGHTDSIAAQPTASAPLVAPEVPMVKAEVAKAEPTAAAPAAPKPKFTKAPKPGETAPAKPAAPRASTPQLPKFDNLPDLVDAVAKEKGLPPAVATAYTEFHALGRSHADIGKDLGIPKSSVGDMIRAMNPLVEEAKVTRLVRDGETVKPAHGEEHVVEENTSEKPVQTSDENVHVDGDEHTEPVHDASAHDVSSTGELHDEDNQVQGQEDAPRGDSNINISDSPHGEGKTSADNNIDATTSAKLGKSWDKLNATLPEDHQVAWKDLGSAQQDAFETEAGKGAARAARAHAQLSELVHEGVRYSKRGEERPSFVINGADGTFNGVKHLTTPDEAAAAKTADKYPAMNVGKSQSSYGFTYNKPDAHEAPVVAAAMDIAHASVVGPMMKLAGDHVDRIGTFMPQETGQQSMGAAYLPVAQVIILNSSFIPDAGHFDKPPLEVAQTLVHEHVHALDRAAGQHATGMELEASTTPLSPTLVHPDFDFDGNKVTLTYGKVVEEALAAYEKDPDKWSDFDQALLGLSAVRAKLDSVYGRIDQLKEGALRRIENIADRATVELTPKLLEMLSTNPKLLDELPLGREHARNLAAADTIEKAAAILGGTDEHIQNGKPATVGGAGEVRSAIRPDAADRPRAVEGRLRRADQEVTGDKGDSAGSDAPADGAGRARELTALPTLDKPGGFGTWVKSITGDKLYRNFPQLLGALSTEQLADRFSEHPLVAKFSLATQKMGGLANKLIGDANSVIRDWATAAKVEGKAKNDAFGQMLLDSTTKGMWPNKDFAHPDHDYLKPAAPDTKVASPAEIIDYNKKLDALKAEHAKLSDAWAKTPPSMQALFTRVERINRDNFDSHVAADRKSIIDSYHPGLADATGPRKEVIDAAAKVEGAAPRRAYLAGLKDAAAEARVSDMWASIDAHKSDYQNRLAGPYFPKSRFGEHVISYESKEFQAAKAALEASKKALVDSKTGDAAHERADTEQEIRTLTRKLARATTDETKARHQADIDEASKHLEKLSQGINSAKKSMQDATNTVNDMKANSDHYAVEFHENREIAKDREKQLTDFFGDDGTKVTRSTRDIFLLKSDGTTPAYMTRISDHLVGALTGVEAEEVRRTVREMHIQNLPGSSALKSQLKRRNVPGVKADEAQRSFASKAIKDAYSISRKTYLGQLHEHMSSLRFGDDTNEDAKILGNELAKRVVLNASMKTNKAIAYATNGTYLAQLGLSPGFMLQQATQQWVNTAPMMAARHGVASATKELARGTADAARLLKVSFDQSKTKMSFHVDIPAGVKAGLVSATEGKMLQEMFDRGRIDISSAHDAGIAAQGGDPTVLSRAAAISNWPVQQLEVINRISTALAGFRAESTKGTYDAAAHYADRLVSETHMNYASENRARFIHPNSWGGWGKVMFQFRAYQQGMAYLTIKNIVDGARGDKEAMKAAGYMAGMQLATAGMAGMPIPGAMTAAAAYIYNKWGDEGNDRDLKEMFYQGLKSVGGDAFATLVTKGVPAALGVDVSEKLGAGHTFDVAPFVRQAKDGRDMTAAYFMSIVGGAAGGQVANTAEAIHLASNGEFAKAAMMLPGKAATDLFKAEEYQRKGMKDSRGNTILHPDEMSAVDTVIKALGLQPTDISRVQDERSAFFTARSSRNDVRAKLLADYATAKIEGHDVADIKERIAAFNERHHDDRIPPGSLPVAVQKRREQERNLKNGVPVGKRDKALYQDVLGD